MHSAPVYFRGMTVWAVVITVALLAQYRGGPTLSLAHPQTLLAVLAAFGGVFSLLPAKTLHRRILAGVGGAAVAALFWAAAPLAWSTVALVGFTHLMFALVSGEQRGTDAALFLGASLVGVVAAHAVSSIHDITPFGWAFIGLKALVIALLLEPKPSAAQRLLGSTLLVLTLGLVVVRVIDVVGALSLPVEASWAEAPFLVDMLKLDAHQPIYGPLADINSYSYSPLLELLHHMLLAPLHVELSLVANRALTLCDLFAASVVFAWAVGPHVAGGLARILPRSSAWGFAIALLASFSSFLAGSIHPDHPTLLCVAVAFALVVREQAWPRWLWWSVLLFVTPVGVAFKLTAAGIGIGLGAVMIIERRWRECLVLAVSAALSAGTIPLFDATCGAFSTYAIAMQRSHPMEWPRLFWAPTIHFAAATALAVAITALLARGAEAETRLLLRRIGLFFGGVIVLMLPAYLKFAGRENNLMALLGAGVLLVLVSAARHALADTPRVQPLLGPSVVLYLIMLVWTPKLGATVTPVPLAAQIQAVDAAMTEDDEWGAQSLVPSAALWIRHGRRDVPLDRTNSAYELFYGHHPEAELFFDHIEDGRYRSIVVWSGDLEHTSTLGFGELYAHALESRYTRVYPPPDVPLAAVGYVIYLRR